MGIIIIIIIIITITIIISGTMGIEQKHAL